MANDAPVSEKKPRSGMQRLFGMVMASIALALLLVYSALSIYARGAEQLDLSRPGLDRVRDQVQSGENFKGFADTGSLDPAAMKEFNRLYQSRVDVLDKTGDFSDKLLSSDLLGFGE